MNKSKLWILVKNEYQTDIRNKSFWLGTLLMPVIMFVFGGLIGFLAKDSDTLQTTSNPLEDMRRSTGVSIPFPTAPQSGTATPPSGPRDGGWFPA